MKKNIVVAFALCMSANAFGQKDTTVTNLREIYVNDAETITQTRIIYPNYTVSGINRETLEEQHRQSVLPTLTEMLPGTLATQRGMMGYGVSGGAAGGINIRGLQSGNGQVMIMINCIPQYQSVFGHGLSDSYLSMIADGVQVIRGPYSTIAGSNAMGGVINISTRTQEQNGTKSHIDLSAGSYGTVQAEAINMVKKGKFSSTVTAQYGRSDNHRPNMGFEQYGGSIDFGYKLNKSWSLFAQTVLTHFNASQPGTQASPMLEADQWITRGTAMVGVKNSFDKLNGRIVAYDNFGIHKINDGYAMNGGKPQSEFFRSKDALAGVNITENLYFIKGNKTTIGLDYQHIYGRAYYTSRETGEVVTTGKRGMQSTHTHSNEVACYIDTEQDLTFWLRLNAGIRYDHHSVTGGEWVPKVSLTFDPIHRPKNYGSIRASVSKGFRNPTTKDLFLYGSANQELLPEKLWNYELSWTHSLGSNGLMYGLNIFKMNGDNLIQTIAVDGKQKNTNTGEISNQGIEFSLEYKVNEHWSLNTNHTYMHMDNPIISTPEYKGYLGASMRYSKWSATVGLLHLNGLYTQVGVIDQADKKETFTLLNAGINYQVLKELKLWVKGENLLAQSYQYIEGYPMPHATFMAGIGVYF